MTARIGQQGKKSWGKEGRSRAAGKGKLDQGGWDRKARTGEPARENNWDRTTSTGKNGQHSQNMTERTGQLVKGNQTGQPWQNSHYRTAGIGYLG